MKLTKLKLLKSQKIILAVGILLLVSGIYLAVANLLSNRHASAQARHDIALANAGKPSPAPATIKPNPAAVASYTVPAVYPRYLTIPKLGVHARVYAVGVTKTGAIGTPSNVYDTAWYDMSSLPGQPGAMLIDGHVSSWTTKGVFYGLKTLVPGDSLNIDTGAGKIYNYSVIKVQAYNAATITAQTLLTPVNKSHPGLNLVTCTGDVIKGSNDFNQREVVYAEQD
jgi:sortase (surface protein transpeptidase)